MSSLKNRILVSFTVSLILFLLIFAVTVFFGFNLSLKDWNRANELKLIDSITKSLEQLYRNGKTDRESINTSLSKYLRENMEITVFGPGGRIIFSHNSDKNDNQVLYNEDFMRSLKEPGPQMHNMMQGKGRMMFNRMIPPAERDRQIFSELFQDIRPPGLSPPSYHDNRQPEQPHPPSPDRYMDKNGSIYNTQPDEGPGRIEDSSRPAPSSEINSSNEIFMRIPENRSVQFIRQIMNKRIDEVFQGQILIRPVIAQREIKAFVRVKSLKFKFYSSVNRKFINSIIITLIAGTTAALSIAIFSSWIISNKLTRDAASLSDGINRLAGGMRNVVFPERGSKEILSISESASILQKELIYDEERRKQWAQDIAHDLRTPITAVKAQIEAVRDGVFKPDTERFIKLLKELGRLERLVEDMNSLSRIESSQNTPELNPVESSDIKMILKERFDVLADEKNIKLYFSFENFTLSCELNLLIRAFSNLIQNSIKYSDKNSEVNVVFRKEENNAVFSVENPGHIEEPEIERIFDRLYRGETGRSSEGSGLGLTIAAAVLKQHNGSIKAENKENSIIFTALMPVKQI